MIGKALGTGKSFSGKINYLFEGKLEEREAANKQATVISHSDNVRVPYSHIDKKGITRMKADFIARSQSYKHYDKSKGYIGEHVLSFTERDLNDLKGKVSMKSMTEEYIKLAGIDKTQYVAITHKDTQNPHVHILFNRVNNEGKIFDATFEKKRAMYAGIVLSQKYGLGLPGELKKVAEEKGVKVMRMQMEDYKELRAGNELLQQARNFHHLEKLSASKGQQFEQRGDKVLLDKKEYSKTDMETMFWQNRVEALTDKEEKGKMMTDEKLERIGSSAPQTVQLSSLEEGAAQSNNEKKVSSFSKHNASIEEGKAKKTKRKRVSDYQQKINKLSTRKQLKL
ncbi:relaxase/mobilization nuclease domain-containing protein [Runella sp. MFBS21]|uniref:relaxase/mobilization nuclease domain-containing protein n=1 Tax=Runella sp. MFBS21 TaxID=3034018 RepID=UPI0023F9306F|nr:relaxase/mobilization nuclease domain-containing protein [Runella sp. MFBS21]MDF7821850.1 relaxase/mobilization nuclease domain-containing protein [Runella sp. MFBS21]